MFKQRKTKARDRGLEIWFLLPESERTSARVLDELLKEGFQVSKATAARWVKRWKAVAHGAVDLIKLPVEQIPTPIASTVLADIPLELREILPDRLLLVARGKGLDRVEHAICTLSDALADRAGELVGADKNLRTIVGALSTMASAMERIVSARALVSTAHRSFAEGDRLLAEAERLRADAKKIDAEATVSIENRAHNAKDITPTGEGPYYDPEMEDEALAALREVERLPSPYTTKKNSCA